MSGGLVDVHALFNREYDEMQVFVDPPQSFLKSPYLHNTINKRRNSRYQKDTTNINAGDPKDAV